MDMELKFIQINNKQDLDILIPRIKVDEFYDSIGTYKEYMPVIINITNEGIDEIYSCFDKNKDRLYYKKMGAILNHLIHRYREGWITSRRQLIEVSLDCFSVIQIIEYNPSENQYFVDMYVYQRSCNIDNALINDIGFLCNWLINRDEYTKRNITIFNIIPHSFKNYKTKVEQ